jgi:hypothetical protein
MLNLSAILNAAEEATTPTIVKELKEHPDYPGSKDLPKPFIAHIWRGTVKLTAKNILSSKIL